MRKCLVCGVPVDDHRDFCTRCYQKKIYEIAEEMSIEQKRRSGSPCVLLTGSKVKT